MNFEDSLTITSHPISKLAVTIIYEFIVDAITVFDAVQSPPLSSPPVNLEESWSLKFFIKKF